MRLGSSYGGWWVPARSLDGESVAYCAGVGTDISFDLELIRTFGCQVWAFDPTPASVSWVKTQAFPDEWHFVPVGLWDEEGTIRFYAPADERLGSLSATNIHGTDRYVEAPVSTLAALMERLGHERVDLLKLDIEGAEGRVLASMFDAEIRPRVLCVEFDQAESPFRLARRIRSILAQDYVLKRIERWNYSFARRDLSAAAS